ncbi:MAG TPA: TIGR02186 family protein [Stellaceae bacterium]|nr:TIGR02186 family protein [Stellaceae bacterium]
MSGARRLLLALALLGVSAAPARAADDFIADLTTHFIAITTGFTGTEVVLFGATDGTGDVIAIVRGPEHDAVVRRKSRVAGLWVNTQQMTFTGVPSYYAVYSSRPLDEIAPPPMQALHQIGLANLRLGAAEKNRSPEEINDFRAALIRQRQREGVFADGVGRIAFLGDRLFRATLQFPANLPTGDYHVEIFLVRDKSVINGQTTPLNASQAGIDGDVYEFANREALLYGIIAVAGAAMAGWLASLPFRNA